MDDEVCWVSVMEVMEEVDTWLRALNPAPNCNDLDRKPRPRALARLFCFNLTDLSPNLLPWAVVRLEPVADPRDTASIQ